MRWSTTWKRTGSLRMRRGVKVPAEGPLSPPVAADFGKIQERSDRRGRWRIDCRPHGVLLSDRGVPFRDRAQAESVLQTIRYRVLRESAASVVADFMPRKSRPNLVGPLLER
jgi:hypothetical protein